MIKYLQTVNEYTHSLVLIPLVLLRNWKYFIVLYLSTLIRFETIASLVYISNEAEIVCFNGFSTTKAITCLIESISQPNKQVRVVKV